MRRVLIRNQTRPSQKPVQADYCASFFCRLRGLMFRKTILPHGGLVMEQVTEDRINAAIHMFFMNFDLTVVWLDSNLRVVDVQYARRWRPAYTPAKPARYVIELHSDRLKDFQAGDQLVFEPC